MDDYFDSCDTQEEAIERAKQVRLIHSQAGFNMRNWVCNDSIVLERLEERKTNQNPIAFKTTTNDCQKRVLGLGRRRFPIFFSLAQRLNPLRE